MVAPRYKAEISVGMNVQFSVMAGVLMVMNAVFAPVVMIVLFRVRAVSMFMGMIVRMLMRMFMRMFVGMRLAVMRMFVRVRVIMLMFVQMLVFVLSFHD